MYIYICNICKYNYIYIYVYVNIIVCIFTQYTICNNNQKSFTTTPNTGGIIRLAQGA